MVQTEGAREGQDPPLRVWGAAGIAGGGLRLPGVFLFLFPGPILLQGKFPKLLLLFLIIFPQNPLVFYSKM